MPRLNFWRHLLSDSGSLAVGGTGTAKVGDSIQLQISEPSTVRGGGDGGRRQGIGLPIPDFADALLFVELEGKKDKFHVGCWFSVYDEAKAKASEAPGEHRLQANPRVAVEVGHAASRCGAPGTGTGGGNRRPKQGGQARAKRERPQPGADDRRLTDQALRVHGYRRRESTTEARCLSPTEGRAGHRSRVPTSVASPIRRFAYMGTGGGN